jgi:hypothetical protein
MIFNSVTGVLLKDEVFKCHVFNAPVVEGAAEGGGGRGEPAPPSAEMEKAVVRPLETGQSLFTFVSPLLVSTAGQYCLQTSNSSTSATSQLALPTVRHAIFFPL